MIRFELQIDLSYDIDQCGADFVFNVHAAHTRCQVITAENLSLSQPIVPQMYTDPASGNRYMRVHALPGELKVAYSATVELSHHRAEPMGLPEVPVRDLPFEVIGYIYPSRYCQSDRLYKLANNEFGQMLQGYSRVERSGPG